MGRKMESESSRLSGNISIDFWKVCRSENSENGKEGIFRKISSGDFEKGILKYSLTFGNSWKVWGNSGNGDGKATEIRNVEKATF